jgi:hypothetical protein
MPFQRYPLPKGVTAKEYETALEYTGLEEWIFKRQKGILIRSMMMVALYRYSQRDKNDWFMPSVLSDEMVPMQPLGGTPLISVNRANSLMRQIIRKTDRWEQRRGRLQIEYRRTK